MNPGVQSVLLFPHLRSLPHLWVLAPRATVLDAVYGGHHGRVVGVVSLGGNRRALDLVHNGSDAAVAETAAVQLAKLSGLSPVAERGLSFTPPNDGDDRTRMIVVHIRARVDHRSLPSVTESDAEALVAQPVHITVKRDIRSGPRDG